MYSLIRFRNINNQLNSVISPLHLNDSDKYYSLMSHIVVGYNNNNNNDVIENNNEITNSKYNINSIVGISSFLSDMLTNLPISDPYLYHHSNLGIKLRCVI